MRVLEDELGTRLLDRTPQGLTLTDAGARLFAEAGPALARLAEAERGLHDASGVSGRLRVSLPPHFDPLWPVLEAFGDRHPGVQFDLFVTERRVDLVADGVDVAIRVGEGGRGSYVGRTLAQYRHRLVATPAFLANVVLCRPEDLSTVDCACWRTASPPTWRLGDATVSLEPVVAINDYRHLLHLALRGRVVTELPPFLARAPLEQGLLVEVLPDHRLPRQAVRALVADSRLLSPLVRQFLDFTAASAPAALGLDSER